LPAVHLGRGIVAQDEEGDAERKVRLQAMIRKNCIFRRNWCLPIC
jgi:hypothetical protein